MFPAEVFDCGIMSGMKKTIVYIDGQNFLYKVSEVLIDAGLIKEKQELYAVNLPVLVKNILPDETPEIRFYGVKKIRRRFAGRFLLPKENSVI